MLESIWRLRSWTLRTAAWAAAIRRREEPVSRALLTLPDAERFAADRGDAATLAQVRRFKALLGQRTGAA